MICAPPDPRVGNPLESPPEMFILGDSLDETVETVQMVRHYQVRGTQSFKIWSVVLLALFAWAVRDGWFPSPSKIELHGPPSSSTDHFYPFNRTLAVLAGLGSVICAIVHKVVK